LQISFFTVKNSVNFLSPGRNAGLAQYSAEVLDFRFDVRREFLGLIADRNVAQIIEAPAHGFIVQHRQRGGAR
jgi:hypothetical protein